MPNTNLNSGLNNGVNQMESLLFNSPCLTRRRKTGREEEILGKSDDTELLTRNIQIKDDFVKDPKVQLVRPQKHT